MTTHNSDLIDLVHTTQWREARLALSQATASQKRAAFGVLCGLGDEDYAAQDGAAKRFAQQLIDGLGSDEIEKFGLLKSAVSSCRASLVSMVSAHLYEDSHHDWHEGLIEAIDKDHVVFFKTFVPFLDQERLVLALNHCIESTSYTQGFGVFVKELAGRIERKPDHLVSMMEMCLTKPLFNDTNKSVLQTLARWAHQDHIDRVRHCVFVDTHFLGRREEALDEVWREELRVRLGSEVEEIAQHKPRAARSAL